MAAEGPTSTQPLYAVAQPLATVFTVQVLLAFGGYDRICKYKIVLLLLLLPLKSWNIR
jgi:prepilin signal peptidase PulO-like enzyme (type II secretory pathway)